MTPIRRRPLVSPGTGVDVVYRRCGVTLTVRGIAVGSGAEGDEVDVKLDNRQQVRGVVTGLNMVRMA